MSGIRIDHLNVVVPQANSPDAGQGFPKSFLFYRIIVASLEAGSLAYDGVIRKFPTPLKKTGTATP